jgi:hypothetical protein
VGTNLSGSTISNSVALNSEVKATATGGGATNAHRIAGDGSSSLNYNWAIAMTLTGSVLGVEGITTREGEAFPNPSVRGDWTALSPAGPGWTIAPTKAAANLVNPWWWDSNIGRPRLYWEAN